jgi:hypothetical protein
VIFSARIAPPGSSTDRKWHCLAERIGGAYLTERTRASLMVSTGAHPPSSGRARAYQPLTMTLESRLRSYFGNNHNDERRFPHLVIENGLQNVSGGVLKLHTVWQNVTDNAGETVLDADPAFALAQAIDFRSSEGNKSRTMLVQHAGWRSFYNVGPRHLWCRFPDGTERPPRYRVGTVLGMRNLPADQRY